MNPNPLPLTRPASQRLLALRLFALVITLLFTFFSYTFLHEGGHALLGLLFGGHLTAFDIGLNAHAGTNGDFTLWQKALISIAGIGLPLLVWTVFLASRRRVIQDNPVLSWLLTIGTMGFYGTLLAWVILPVLFLLGVEAADDSVNFLRITGFPPLLVSAAALVAWLGGLGLFVRKAGGLRGLRHRLNETTTWQSLPAASYTTLRWLAALLLLILLSTFVANRTLGPQDFGRPPEGYAPAFETSLAEKGLQAEPVYSFTLNSSSQVRFFFLLLDFQDGPLQLTLWGPQGVQFTFLNFEQKPGIGKATVQPDAITLPPGDYEIRLTAPKGPSTLNGYMKLGE